MLSILTKDANKEPKATPSSRPSLHQRPGRTLYIGWQPSVGGFRTVVIGLQVAFAPSLSDGIDVSFGVRRPRIALRI